MGGGGVKRDIAKFTKNLPNTRPIYFFMIMVLIADD